MDERNCGKMKKVKKSNTAEVQARVLAICDLIAQGATRSDIVQFCSNEYGISERHGDTYLAKAYAVMREQAEEAAENYFSVAIARYTKLYAKNYKVQDFRECRNVQQAIDKLTLLKSQSASKEKPADPLSKLRKIS